MVSGAVLQGALPYRAPLRGIRNEGGTGGKKARPSSKRADTRAFLNAEVWTIAVVDTDMFGMELQEAYDRLLKGLERFFKMTGRRFLPPMGRCIADSLCLLIEYTEKTLEKDGIELCVKKDDDELYFTLFRHVYCLDDVVYIFYMSPADTLKGEESLLYKKYIRYISDCFGLTLNPDVCENNYMDMLLNSMYDEMQDDEAYENERKLVAFYSKGGKAYVLANEICQMEVDHEELRRELEEYRKEKADGDMIDMVDMMLEGMDILPHMNICNYDFNPIDDGFDTNDGYIDISSTLAFIYSSKDSMEDMIIESINQDAYCGLYQVGWNKFLSLDCEYTKDEFDFFMSGDGIQKRFREWTTRYYNVVSKFDEYGTDRPAETKA